MDWKYKTEPQPGRACLGHANQRDELTLSQLTILEPSEFHSRSKIYVIVTCVNEFDILIESRICTKRRIILSVFTRKKSMNCLDNLN